MKFLHTATAILFAVAIMAAAGIARPGLYFSSANARPIEGPRLPVRPVREAVAAPALVLAHALRQADTARERALKPARIFSHGAEHTLEIAAQAGPISDPEDLPPQARAR